MLKPEFLEAGKIANTHGIAGDVVADSYCNSAGVLADLKALFLKKGETFYPLTVQKATLFKGRVLFHFEGYDTIEAAIPLKNQLLYTPRSSFSLNPGEHFIVDLIGLPVYDETSSEYYGIVSDVVNYGANDLYEITRPNGKKALVPGVPAFVRKIDLEKGIFLHVIEGLL